MYTQRSFQHTAQHATQRATTRNINNNTQHTITLHTLDTMAIVNEVRERERKSERHPR